ncbi:MAG: hypothetical protein VKQ33_15735 [Candidatus Sericytochromatia bacterium]|nr:hypothetical protein [Candidatus Sericytochromatia bacterium]
MPDAGEAVALVFLSDLRLVSSIGALGAYGAWLVTSAASAASLGRLALTVVLAATGAMLVLAGASQLPLREWFLAAWVAVWLATGLLYNMTVLGAPVAAGALVLMGWAYAAPATWGQGGGGPLSDVARYWSHLRDGLTAVAGASLGLALVGAVVRALIGERRTSRVYAPLDVGAASRVLARAAGILGGGGVIAAALAWHHAPASWAGHAVHILGLVCLLAVSTGWLALGRSGEEPGWRLALLAFGGAAACAWLFAGARVAAYLTRGAAGP